MSKTPIQGALPGSFENKYRRKVFRVEDGGTQFVAAPKITDAYQIMSEPHGMSQEEYVREFEPSIREMKPLEQISIDVSDHLPKFGKHQLIGADSYPPGARLDVTAKILTHVEDWMKFDFTGLIATSEV